MNYLGAIFICTINVICIDLIKAASAIRNDLVNKNKQESKESPIEEGSSRSFYPFITCQQCDTFLQCFLRCPFAEYPGINRFVTTKNITTSQSFVILYQIISYLYLIILLVSDLVSMFQKD